VCNIVSRTGSTRQYYIPVNVAELISSGKLELYVAGSLAEGERNEVRAYAMAFPEIACEIEQIQDAMLDYVGSEDTRMDRNESNDLFSRICEDIQLPEPVSLKTGGLLPLRRPSRLLAAAAAIGDIIRRFTGSRGHVI